MLSDKPRRRFSTSATRVRATQDRFEVLAVEALLLHSKFDRLDRVGRIDWMVLALIGVDQSGQYIEPISFRGAREGAPQPLDV